jgi:hypothetical protein
MITELGTALREILDAKRGFLFFLLPGRVHTCPAPFTANEHHNGVCQKFNIGKNILANYRELI